MQKFKAPRWNPDFFEQIKAKCPNIFFILTRTTNENVVVYELNLKHGKINTKNPVNVFWLNVDPGYTCKQYESLTFTENRYVYGITTTILSSTHVRVKFKFNNFTIDVYVEQNGRVYAKHNNKKVERAHIVLRTMMNPISLYQIVKRVYLYEFKSKTPKTIF